jgi:hypothetical protein
MAAGFARHSVSVYRTSTGMKKTATWAVELELAEPGASACDDEVEVAAMRRATKNFSLLKD